MKQVIFVAFHGPAFSGKDTCTELLLGLRQERTYGVLARFAEPIYEMIGALVPGANSRMSKAEKEQPRPELGGLSIRQMAVALGEGARAFNKSCWINIWADSLLEEVVDTISYGFDKVLVVVPDLRKADERDALHALPARLMDGMAEAWPESKGKVEAASVLVHVQSRNSPVNEQHDPVTETPLEYEERDLVLMNDHGAGLESLGATLAGTFALASHHAAHTMFLNFLRPDAWKEAVDALDARPA